MKFKSIALAALAPLAAVGFAAGISTAASAAVGANTTLTQHISNRADSGNGGTWALDTFTRTLTVHDLGPTGANGEKFSATVVDKGTFITVPGAKTPNQFVPGTVLSHQVHGSFTGGQTFIVTAPAAADALKAAGVLASENDHGSAAAPGDATGVYPLKAFVTAPSAPNITPGAWAWKYSTACESWTDSSANGDGNTAGAGNITGKICTVHPAPPVSAKPYVYAGHDVTVGTTRATVGWSESAANAPWLENLNPPVGGKCEEVREWGFGFSAADGSPHVGFTCSHDGTNTNVGVLTGLTPGHTYALEVTPAVGTYASHHPIPGAHSGFINVVTATS